MKKLNKSIIIVLIIIIILSVFLIVLHSKYKKVFTKEDIEEISKGNQSPDLKINQGEPLNNPTMFYTVLSCINIYLHDCSTAIPMGSSIEDQKEAQMSESQKIERVYNELSSEYIQENNITKNNIREYIHSSSDYLSFYPISMNILRKENKRIENYGAYGRIKNTTTGNFVGEIYIIVTIDQNNMTYAVKPIINNQITSIDELDLDTNIEIIDKNENNNFTYTRVNEESLLRKYLNTYAMYARFNPEIAYEYLDKEYRDTRFGNLNAYISYMQKNKDIIGVLDKYQKTTKDEYTQYVCIDTNGNYYIFRETATMQYTLLLDTYTIDIPEFTEKYEKADEMTKVGMNIEKIKSALNAKDYNYVYNKFNSGFKNNYFKTVEEFENYVKSNWFNNINITYNKVSEEGNIYVFQVYLSDATGKSSNVITKNFNMQLKSGTDFIFSFEV